MKKTDEEFRFLKFKEMKKLKYKIRSLMSIFQNPLPITEKNLIDFENEKNELINQLNRIYTDLKIEYDKTKENTILNRR